VTDELTARAGEVRDEVAALRLEVQQLREIATRATRVSMRAVFAIVVLLVLLGVVATNVWQQHETADRLESLTQRSLCPVYGLVVGGYDPTTRALNPDGSYAGSPRAKYDEGFDVMRAAFGELACTSTDVIPKRTDG
jgi:hypothetical protein